MERRKNTYDVIYIVSLLFGDEKNERTMMNYAEHTNAYVSFKALYIFICISSRIILYVCDMILNACN